MHGVFKTAQLRQKMLLKKTITMMMILETMMMRGHLKEVLRVKRCHRRKFRGQGKS